MKYKAVIWDLDGTLLDTLDDLADSVNVALAEYSMPQRSRSEIKSFVGNGIYKLITRAVKEGTSNESMDEIFDFFKEYYAKNSANKTKPYDGINELLYNLKQNGIKTAIASNKLEEAVEKLADRYFDGLIDIALGDVNYRRRKPYPDIVTEAVSRLGINMSEAVYIGDSEVDIKTAENAKIDCICVTWGFRDKEFLKEILNESKCKNKFMADNIKEVWEIIQSD